MPFGSIGSPECCCGPPVVTCGSCTITATSGTLVVHGCGPSGFSCAGGISPGGVGTLLTGGADAIAMTSPLNAIGLVSVSTFLGSEWIFFNCHGGGTYDWIQWSAGCRGGVLTLSFGITTSNNPVRPARAAVGDTFGIITTSGFSSTTAFTCSPLSATFSAPVLPASPFYSGATFS